MEESIQTSSPDPLGLSFDSRFSVASPLKLQEQARKPSLSNSTSASLANFASTPKKTTNGGFPHVESPWRIRITVAAEQENYQPLAAQSYKSANVMGRPNTRSKGEAEELSQTEEIKTPARKGRPRKSDASAVASGKKSGPPKGKSTPAKRTPRQPRKSALPAQSSPLRPESDLHTVDEQDEPANEDGAAEAAMDKPQASDVAKPLQTKEVARNKPTSKLVSFPDEEAGTSTPTAAQLKIRTRVQTPARSKAGAKQGFSETRLQSSQVTSTTMQSPLADDTNLWSEADSVAVAKDDTVAFDRSLAESEEFTMVSIHSLRSQQEQMNQTETGTNAKDLEGTTSTDASSAKGAQTPPQSRRPSVTMTLQPAAENKSTPKTGAAQQDQGLSSIGNVFRGFGDMTRRGLRAGFAMGELLGRGDKTALEQIAPELHLHHPRPALASTAGSSRLLTPADSVVSSSGAGNSADNAPTRLGNESRTAGKAYDQMSWEPIHNNPNSEYDVMSWRATNPESLRPAEVDVNTTDTSNTFTYNDDTNTEHENDNAADIWQEEAARSGDGKRGRRSKNLKRKANNEQHGQTLDFEELFGEDSRPARAKIPKTWRRSSGSDFLYGDEAVPVEPEQEAPQDSPFNFRKYFPQAKPQTTTPSQENSGTTPRRAGSHNKSGQKEVRFSAQSNRSRPAKEDYEYFSSDESAADDDDDEEEVIDETVYPRSTRDSQTPIQERAEITTSSVRLPVNAINVESAIAAVDVADEADQSLSLSERKQRKQLRSLLTYKPPTEVCDYRAYSAPYDSPEHITHLYYLFPPLFTWLTSFIPRFSSSVIQTLRYEDWTRNHTCLLRHYIRLSIAWLDNDQPEPWTDVGPLDMAIPPPSPSFTDSTLPRHLQSFVGMQINSAAWNYSRKMSEADVRVAWAFILEARQEGVMQWKDARDWDDQENGGKWLKVDENRVAVWNIENWAVIDVLRHVYILWESSVMMEEERAKVRKVTISGGNHLGLDQSK